jgi:hypothetical protein
MRVSVLAFALSLVSTSAMAGSFRHTLRNFPIAEGASCEESAFQIGQSFAAFGSVSEVSSRCIDNWEGRGKKDIEIRYTAEVVLNVISTSDSVTALSTGGTYKSRETCEADMAAEIPVFEQLTGLRPFISYCESFGSFGDHRLHIKAIGEAAVRPYVTTLSTMGTILGHTRETFTAMIRARLKHLNAELAQLGPSTSPINSEMNIRYYGSDRLNYDEVVIAKFETAEACQAQVVSLFDILTAHDDKHLAVYCQNTGIVGIELVAQASRSSELSLVVAEGEYKTAEECAAQVDAVVTKYRERYNHKVLMGACSKVAREKFVVNLLEH